MSERDSMVMAGVGPGGCALHLPRGPSTRPQQPPVRFTASLIDYLDFSLYKRSRGLAEACCLHGSSDTVSLSRRADLCVILCVIMTE